MADFHKSIPSGLEEKAYLVRSLDLCDWVDVMNPHLQLVRDEQAEEFGGVVLELLACLEVSEQCRAGNFDALRGEAAGLHEY